MKRKDWKPKTATERRYERALRRAAEAISKTVQGKTTLEQIISALVNFTKNPKFIEYAQIEALKMVKSIVVENAATWREAAFQSGKSQEIHRLLKAEFAQHNPFNEIVRQNAEHIRLLPQSLAKQITKTAANNTISGLRPEALAKEIKAKVPDLAEWQARRIARTEVSKTQAAITQVRAQEVGLNWYIWRTCQDQRVRSSHAHMEGVICDYNHPPSPEQLAGEKSQGNYGPGEIFNCRCYAEVIVDADFVQWPSKIVVNGRIVPIGKKQFLDLSQNGV